MQFLRTSDADFDSQFAAIVDDRRESDSNVSQQVSEILAAVKQRGDVALAEFSQRFDQHDLSNDTDWVVSRDACRQAHDALDPKLRDALELSLIHI